MEGLSFYKNHNTAAIELTLKDLLTKTPATEDDKLSVNNDIAVQYIKLGKLDEAAMILQELAKKYPDNYSVIVNLGTLYELQGKNKEALQLIKKAVVINPESHGGSEWFHVKLLEFKLNNIPADKIADQNILDLYKTKVGSEQVAEQIRYQLKERIPFTPAPNLVFAKVLQEYGDFLADSVSIRAAYIIYEMGMDYDKDNILKLEEKKESLKPYFKKHHEAVPVTGSYYIDKFLPAEDIDKVKVATSVLEKGFNYFKEQEEKRRQEEKQKQYFIFGGIGLAAILAAFLFYKRRK
jgi:tetratricopeptide (TPR) repeat protein